MVLSYMSEAPFQQQRAGQAAGPTNDRTAYSASERLQAQACSAPLNEGLRGGGWNKGKRYNQNDFCYWRVIRVSDANIQALMS